MGVIDFQKCLQVLLVWWGNKKVDTAANIHEHSSICVNIREKMKKQTAINLLFNILTKY